MLLTGLLAMLLSLFSNTIQDHQLKDGTTTHSELGLPMSIINQEDISQAILVGIFLN